MALCLITVCIFFFPQIGSRFLFFLLSLSRVRVFVLKSQVLSLCPHPSVCSVFTGSFFFSPSLAQKDAPYFSCDCSAPAMALDVADVVRTMSWFWGLLPLCYYIALTVVCGMYRHWISFGFALANATTLVVWLVLNSVAMVSARQLSRREAAAVTSNEHPAELSMEDVARAFPQRGVSSPRAIPPPAQPVPRIDTEDTPRAFEDDDDSVDDLTSIPDSVVTNVHTNTNDTSLFSAVLEGRSPGPGNPLAAARPSGKACGRRGLVVHAQPAAGGDRRGSDGDGSYLLSSPESDRAMAEGLSRAAGQTLVAPSVVPAHGRADAAAATKKVSSDSGSVGSGAHDGGGGGADMLYGKARDGTRGKRRHSSCCVSCCGPYLMTKVYRAAYMMPAVSIYVTLVFTVLVLVASILFEYETHCLMLAFPALCMPGLWSTLIPLLSFFDAHKQLSMAFHVRLLRVATHWGGLTVITIVGLIVYVVAMALESSVWTPYEPNKVPVERAVRIVSYVTPIPSVLIVALFVVNNSLIARSLSRRNDRKRQIRQQQQQQQQHEVVAPRDDVLRFGQLTNFPRMSESAQLVVSPPAPSHQLDSAAAHNSSSLPLDMDDSISTLSSIVRSSMGSSVFIPHSSVVTASTRSPSKLQVRASRTSSSGSTGAHGLLAAAHVSTLPQLKTVTMLYIAYRNIFDDSDFLKDFSGAGKVQGGMAANRNMQQTISANYEALMEAVEDAREQGRADDNAYVLTAYEDALCLVWGLMPFSSEPVLLAIEKARQIMEAFRSRPKPPPTSADEQPELVAAIVSAPHSLVGFLGTGNYRSVHFFNPHQHQGGCILMRRAMAMYRRLPSMQNAGGGSENVFSGILMNSRARNNTASQILARPCGIKYIPPLRDDDTGAIGVRRLQMGLASKLPVEQYPIMYEFLDFVQAKEEEWHLVVQRQERLGAKFSFLTEATQLLQQGDTKAAKEVLTRAIEGTDRGHEADNVVLAQMTLEDLAKFATVTVASPPKM